MNYTAYAHSSGHIAKFETPDKSLAIDVAHKTAGNLALSRGEQLDRSFFEDIIGDPMGNVARVGFGDYGVGIDDSTYNTALDSDGETIYTVHASTYNSAREFEPEKGIATLQAAFVSAVNEVVERRLELSE